MISQAQLQSVLLKPHPEYFFLDVRTAHEYQGGHLPDAVNIPIDQLEGRLAEVPNDKKIVCICQHGVRSGIAAEFLTEQKYQADSLQDGLSVWNGKLIKS